MISIFYLDQSFDFIISLQIVHSKIFFLPGCKLNFELGYVMWGADIEKGAI